MPCETTPFETGQTLSERKQQVKDAVDSLARALAAGTAKAIVGPQGAITFQGWTERKGITDACAFRKILVGGNHLAKAKIQAAELLSGRSVNRQAVAQGHHSHDNGKTWHHGH